MKEWQFNILFALAVGGAVIMLFGDKIGVTVRPEVVGIFGLVMAYVLQQHDSRKKDKDDEHRKGEGEHRKQRGESDDTSDPRKEVTE